MGWENVFHCEYDPFCQKVLNHHFPNSKLYEDIKTFDASDYFGRIDILSGGFPCQPFSNAGLRKGTEDDRHLWPQMLRIIREVSPRYVVGENVRGLLNWSGGLVFEQVCADLENEGYEVTPYLLPAAGKNAPHRRDRIWFVAYRNEPSTGTDVRGMSGEAEEIRGRKKSFVSGSLCSDGDASDTKHIRLEHGTNPEEVEGGQGKMEKEGGEFTQPIEADGKSRDAPNTDGIRLSEHRPNISSEKGKRREKAKRSNNREQVRARHTDNKHYEKWQNFPTQPPLCGGNDGLPKELDGITFPKWRKESIKAYGNAIVPQVAHEIFKAIQKMEDTFVS